MADFIAALWREFEVETHEHLDAVELILLAAESGSTVSADQIAALFRAFHSVKGLARAMDLRGMEEIAHGAESVLSLVRDGRAPLNAALVAVVLPALDALKAGRRLALEERRDQAAPAGLIAALEQTYRRLGDGASRVALDGVGGRSAVEPPRPQSQQDTPTHQAGPMVVARDAPEMQEIFVELLQAALPVFSRIVTANFASPDIQADTLGAIERIDHAAETMGYLALVDYMRVLREIVTEAGGQEAEGGRPLYPDARKTVLGVLGRIGEVLKEIDRSACGAPSRDAGGAIPDLQRILGRAFEDELRETYCNLIQALTLFSPEDESGGGYVDNDEALAEDVAGMARLLYSFVLFLGWPRSGDVLLVIEDIFSRIAAEEISLSIETVELTHNALTTVFDCVVEGHHLSNRGSDITAALAREFTLAFRKSLLATLNPTRASLAPLKVGQRFLATLEIKPALLEMLSPENVTNLMDLVQVGHAHLYEVLAQPEKSPELTRAFLAWTESQVKPITNRTVFIDGETWFEFLMASMDPPEVIAASAAAIDPAGSFIQVSPCQLKANDGAAAPQPPNDRRPRARVAEAQTVAPAPAVMDVEPERSMAGDPPVRVNGEAIDALLNQIGEMISLNGAFSLTMQDSLVGSAVQSLHRGLRMLSDDGAHPEAEALIGVVDVLGRYIDRIRQVEGRFATALARLQDGVLDLRVVPVDRVFGRFPRLVRDLAQHLGKQVRLDIDGGAVRIDKGIVEALFDPLMHMVRNAIDHGVETPEVRIGAGKPPGAVLTLRAYRKGNRVMIEVHDDGAGLDIDGVRRIAVERGLIESDQAATLGHREICHFIFQPGFSTAGAITATSGRGVGMDVVWTAVNRLGGTIAVDSDPGQGTCFSLSLPLSAAIQSALIVAADGNIMAIPERYFAETCQIAATEIQTVRGQSAIVLRDQFLPVFPLTRLLGHATSGTMPVRFPVVVIENGRQRIGLIVDRLYRRQDLFMKDIHPQLAAIPGVGGASTLGDGRVILVLDGDDLFRLAEASVRIDADGIGAI